MIIKKLFQKNLKSIKTLTILLFSLLSIVFVNCSHNTKKELELDKDNGSSSNSFSHSDVIPPGAITDLKAQTGKNRGEVTLTFTAPGNDGYSLEKPLNGAYYIQYSKKKQYQWVKNKAQVIHPISDVNYGLNDRLSIALFGDPQYGYEDLKTDKENVILTYDDLKDVPHDFLVVLGDLVQPMGDETMWWAHRKYTIGLAPRPVYLINGNAESYLGDEIFTQEIGVKVAPYKVEKRGIRFIFLFTTGTRTGIGEPQGYNHQCEVGNEQMTWLKNELASDTQSTTIIFFHAPIANTTFLSGKYSRFPNLIEPLAMVESKEMKGLFEKYPNIKVYANGHQHIELGEIDDEGQGQYKREGNVLHISVGRPPNTVFLFIEKDKIDIRVRDNKNKKWHSKYGYTYEVKTSLQEKELDSQDITIKNLEPGSKYYFRIWTKDGAGNYSEISNSASSLSQSQ